MPDPLQQSVSFFDDDEDDNTTVSSLEDLLQNEVNDQTLDLGARFANRLQLQMRGYFSGNASLKADETIAIMVVDSATPGRMGIPYYREFSAREYIEQLKFWHEQFAWPQRLTNEQKQANTLLIDSIRAVT